MFNRLNKIVFGVLLLYATGANAQNVPNNIDNRFNAQSLLLNEADTQNALLTGNSDVLLMRRTKLLTFFAQLGSNDTDNAALSPTDPTYDKIGNGLLGVRVSTTIANKFNVFADLSASGVRYSTNADLDYSALSGAIGVSLKHKGLDFTLSHQPSIVFDRGFDKRQLKQYRTSMTIGYPMVIKGFYIYPSAHIVRATANPSDYNHADYGGEIGIMKKISAKLPLYIGVNYALSRKSYDSYFADFLGTDRNDRNKSADISLRYDINERMSINISYEETKNYSTSDVNEFKVANQGFTLSFNTRF